jgi:hypothetical protein
MGVTFGLQEKTSRKISFINSAKNHKKREVLNIEEKPP